MFFSIESSFLGFEFRFSTIFLNSIFHLIFFILTIILLKLTSIFFQILEMFIFYILLNFSLLFFMTTTSAQGVNSSLKLMGKWMIVDGSMTTHGLILYTIEFGILSLGAALLARFFIIKRNI